MIKLLDVFQLKEKAIYDYDIRIQTNDEICTNIN